MAMKYACEDCHATCWISGSHTQCSIFKHYPKCHKCGGRMIMPGTPRKVKNESKSCQRPVYYYA